MQSNLSFIFIGDISCPIITHWSVLIFSVLRNALWKVSFLMDNWCRMTLCPCNYIHMLFHSHHIHSLGILKSRICCGDEVYLRQKKMWKKKNLTENHRKVAAYFFCHVKRQHALKSSHKDFVRSDINLAGLKKKEFFCIFFDFGEELKA